MAFPFSFRPYAESGIIIVHSVLIKQKNILASSRSLTFRLEFWFQSIEISNAKDIEKDEESSPENISPKGRKQLGERRRHHPTPIDKPQNENKKEEEEEEPFEDLFPPQVTKPNEKEGKKSADQMILFLKLVNLKRFLVNNPGVKFFLLNENTITIETNKFLVRGS